MKKLAYIGVAAVALISIPVAAQVAGRHRGPDAGPLTRASVQAMVEARFAKADSDHDGFVTRQEADARMSAGRGDMQGRRGEMRERMQARRGEMQGDRGERGGERRQAMFDRFDANKDGSISRAEFDAAASERAERREARGGEGRPGMERQGMRQGRAMRGGGMHRGGKGMAGGFGPNMFERLDADHDGRVSLAEASSRALAMFDRVDANRDGTITPEERAAARERFREGRQDRDDRRGG